MASPSRWKFLLDLRTKIFPGVFVKPTCIGQDSRGNKYYEIAKPNHKRKVHRYYEPPSLKDAKDFIELAKIPPAWESWLKFRRQEPPSEDEIRESQEYEEMWRKDKGDKRAKGQAGEPRKS